MNTKKKITAICGSTRTSSTNLSLIKAIVALTADQFDVTIFEGLAEIPHFNPDLDNEHPPKQVSEFRELLQKADGILICTPEYAMGVPGSLKNAIDWTVSSCEFSHKPTALITASSLGKMGHASLMETLKIIEAGITEKTQLLIPFAKAKINTKDEITDEQTLDEVKRVMAALNDLMTKK